MTAPQTTLHDGPTLTDDSEFVFSADESATFACSLDGMPFRPCSSPTEYDDLKPGQHTFAVRATDDAGNIDRTPDEWTWRTLGLGLDDAGSDDGSDGAGVGTSLDGG